MSEIEDIKIVTACTEVISNMQSRIKELEQQSAELMAYVDDFKTVRSNWHGLSYNDASTFMEFIELCDQTPKQSLANIKADAIEEILNTLLSAKEGTETYTTLDVLKIVNYIDQLREQNDINRSTK